MEGNQANSRLKILTLGESGVGKTCILLRFTGDYYFQHHINTIGVDYKQKELSIEENGTQKKVKLCIWDTAGQEKFRKIARSYYKGAHGILLVYSVEDRDTFKKLIYWMEEIKNLTAEEVEIVLVGNKIDIRKEENKEHVTTEMGKKFAEKYKMSFIETSALSNININECFDGLARRISEKLTDEENLRASNRMENLSKVGEGIEDNRSEKLKERLNDTSDNLILDRNKENKSKSGCCK
eukprot:CAMPEP_0170523346 /NCGR_PEP_ID=MMETSP0209-20121228/8791_1 /TAXON_ID=665100 ORGANISM="Litonotus pictus, Strain P1" /NCGR_SAMPLE_ID=MMETSP0209 /ASSEMBLY_ACC=CAM_ASM_000301 /LENGTH=238 /DNA_ID=CAMNT_0010811401 /DNA_START=10 /DNA_END=726 /DNA_ORIENTATION=+